MDSGNITFNVPDEFTPLTDREIDTKFPRHTGSIDAIGNSTRGVTISYTVSQTVLKPDQLLDFKAALEAQLPKLTPGLIWIKKDVSEINGRKWIYFEFTTTTPDGGIIHNFMLITSYDGNVAILNFNATDRLFASYKTQLSSGIQSIKIRNSVSATPEG